MRTSRLRFLLASAAAVTLSSTAMRSVALEAPQLRSLLKDARIVAVGEVGAVTPYKDGRVAVADFHASRVLKGRLPAAGDRIAIVEMRELPTPPVFTPGRIGVVFLRPSTSNTFLVSALPRGTYFEPTSKELGFLRAESPAELGELGGVIDQLLAMSRKPETDAAGRAAAARKLTFDLVSAHQPVLVQDGGASLASIPGLSANLSEDEKRRLEGALRRSDLPVRARLALVQGVSNSHLQQLVPVLRELDAPPELLAASWKALDALHAPPPVERLEERLAAPDPAVRAAAVRELLRREGTDAIGKVGPLAIQDPDHSVRLAAIDGLGDLKRPEALAPLERVFSSEEGDLQQAAARGIVAIGGDPGADALGRLAFQAPPGAQRYALMLLLVEYGKNDPRVQRVATSHPDASMRAAVNEPLNAHTHSGLPGHALDASE